VNIEISKEEKVESEGVDVQTSGPEFGERNINLQRRSPENHQNISEGVLVNEE